MGDIGELGVLGAENALQVDIAFLFVFGHLDCAAEEETLAIDHCRWKVGRRNEVEVVETPN